MKEEIIKDARELGFDLVGFAEAKPLDLHFEHYSLWLSSGFHATMKFLENNLSLRENPALLLDGAKSIIVLGTHYNAPFDYNDNKLNESVKKYGKIARYAWGDDYHEVLNKSADLLIERIKNKYAAECRRFTDTGPTLDRAWAEIAGLGWQGKNGNIINFDIGSYFFITLIITNLSLEPDSPVKDFCGTCRRCISACPTGAIVEPKVVDSRKCLAYWTIESKNEPIPLEIANSNPDRLFGCDICQEVCPWNKKSIYSTKTSFYPREGDTSLELEKVLSLKQEEFSSRFKNSAIKRTKISGLQKAAASLINTHKKPD